MRRFIKIAVPFTVLLVLAAAVLFYLMRPEEASTPEYKLSQVKKGKLKAIVSSTGKVSALNTVMVGSQVSGNIKELYVDFNSSVQKNQLIARIDPAIYAAQLEQARAQRLKARAQLYEKQREVETAQAGIVSAEANINSARATLKAAQLNYARLSALMGKMTVAQAKFDEALAKRDNAQSALEVAQAKLVTSRAQVERIRAAEKAIRATITEKKAALKLAQIRMAYCDIRSPIDGVVIYRNVDVGQTVAASLQSPVLFHIAEDLKRMQVEVDVSEADVGQIDSGQKVEFTVDAYPEEKFRAVVRQVRNFATEIQNVVTYKIMADVDNASLKLKPGMTANVNIIVSEKDNVLKLPNAALRFKPLGEVKKAKPKTAPPVRERERFKKTIKGLKMDGNQADAYAVAVAQADVKLKSALAETENRAEKREAYILYLKQLDKGLETILRDPQLVRYRNWKKMMEKRRKMNPDLGRQASVYVLDDDGLPQEVKLTIGVTNDEETELRKGRFKEGDRVIVGLAFNIREPKNKVSALFKLFRRR